MQNMSKLSLFSFLIFSVSFFSQCTPKKTETETSTANLENSPTPAKTKSLTFVIGDDVKSGDPATFNDVISAEVMGNIFEGLYGFRYLGKMGDIEPVLAETLPVYSDKNKTLTITLKKGILFADDPAFPNSKGREVTADDFIYSVKRIAEARNTSSNWWMFDGMVVGLNEWRHVLETAPSDKYAETFAKDVPGLQSPDSHTIVLKLIKPYPQLLSILAMNPTAVTAKEVVEKYAAEIINHPIGTGPYKIKEWVRGSKIVLEKNANFRSELYPSAGSDEDKTKGLLAASGQKLPIVDLIQFEIIKEEQPRWLHFKSGNLAYANIPKDNFKEAIGADGQLSPALANDGVQLHKAMSLTSWWLEFNLKDPILGKNKKLRQAIAHAFDRAKALNLLYNDRGILSSSPVPPDLEGGSNLEAFPYAYDLEKAKKLLAEAGFKDGKGLAELSLDLRGTNPTNRQFGEFLQSNLAAIGIKLNILANSFPEALEKTKSSKFQMMLAGWAADYPDPENFLALWYGPNKAPGNNTSNFQNKEFDKLYDKIRIENPGPERVKAVQRMTQILNDEVPVVFFFHAMDYVVSRNWLKNYKPHLLLYGGAKYLDLDTGLKAR